MKTLRALLLLCAGIVLAGLIMFWARADTTKPTVDQAWAWSYLPCLRTERYQGTESYRPCGKCGLQDRPVMRTRCVEPCYNRPRVPRAVLNGGYILRSRAHAAGRVCLRTATQESRVINPGPKDIGRRVQYTPFPGGKPEIGHITTFNKSFVFVRYGGDRGAKATRREDLEWV